MPLAEGSSGPSGDDGAALSATQPAGLNAASEQDALTAPVDLQPETYPVGRAARVGMLLLALALSAHALLVNTIGVNLLSDARLGTRWSMFSAPPRRQPTVVMGVPREGPRDAPNVVLFDPNAADRPLLERIRDARERKWHDNATKNASIQQPYLTYLCRLHGEKMRMVRLVWLATDAKPEKVVAERRCPAPARRAGGT